MYEADFFPGISMNKRTHAYPGITVLIDHQHVLEQNQRTKRPSDRQTHGGTSE